MPSSHRNVTIVYACGALILIALTWSVAWSAVRQDREWRMTSGIEEAQRLAAFFEGNTLSVFRYGDAFASAVRREYVSGGVEAVRAVIEEVGLDTDMVSHVTVIDADGTPVYNSRYPIKPGSSAFDRPYFQYFERAQIADGDVPYVSLPHRGRNSGRLIVRLVRPITLPGGAFGGVVFAAIDADAIVAFFEALKLGPRSSATLVGTDQRIRARSSWGRLGPGQDISGSRIWRELAREPVGGYHQTSVVDGVRRYYAYRQLEEYPLIVAIGASLEDILGAAAGYRRVAIAVASLTSVVIVMIALALARERTLARRLRRMGMALERRFRERTAELEAVQGELLVNERLAALGQLTGTVAHELRNPLGTITSSMATIERRLADAAVDPGSAPARIHRSIDRCDRIITELLDFARAQGLDARPVVVDAWLPEVLGDLDLREGVALETAPGAPGTTVALDTERVRRAVVNLVENARDAIAGSGRGVGRIRVATRPARDGVEIEVADTGPGIPEAQLERVREPLFSTKTFGFGLGLPIVDRVAEEHGGRLAIETRVGAGTTATLWLPSSPRAAEPGR